MRIFFPLIAVFLLNSCSPANSDKTNQDSVPQVQTQAPVLKKGDITDLFVVSNPSNSYSVYLPTNYDSTKKYPVVIFFDAHGNGKLPLNNYKTIAEKWGYIFVGSNSSKNGMAGDVTMQIGNELIEEAKKSLPIDNYEIMVCGFSGGARVASNIALSRNDVKGLICNSAAPQKSIPGKVFVGLAGLGDMNYLEMKKFVDLQKTSGNKSPNELLVFDGKHEWAPVDFMEDAMLMTNINGIENIITHSDSLMAKGLAENLLHQADTMKKISCLIESSYLEIGIRSTRDYHGPNELVNRNDILRQTSCFVNDVGAWLTAESEENKLQQEIGNAIMSQDTTWWKANANKYFESKKVGADKFMHQRLRGYASLMCYSYANQAFKSNNLHAAEKLVAIYSIVDPTNSEWVYMRATLYMQIGLADNAIALLEKAVELGFNDRNRLQNDVNFSSLHSNVKFSELMEKLK